MLVTEIAVVTFDQDTCGNSYHHALLIMGKMEVTKNVKPSWNKSLQKAIQKGLSMKKACTKESNTKKGSQKNWLAKNNEKLTCCRV